MVEKVQNCLTCSFIENSQKLSKSIENKKTRIIYALFGANYRWGVFFKSKIAKNDQKWKKSIIYPIFGANYGLKLLKGQKWVKNY